MDFVDHWIVGFSGKRSLENPEAVRHALREVLLSLQKLAHGELVAISSAAIGSDLLFVEEATRAGIPWICVLPFPADMFFNARDFPDEQVRTDARQKINQAADCEVIRVPRDATDLNDPAWRRAAFAEAGFKCVDTADLFLAVFDEVPGSGKPGGTRDAVAHARASKRPVIIVNPLTPDAQPPDLPAALRDPLTEQLRRLQGASLKQSELEPLPTRVASAVAAWRNAFARAARRHLPGIRWANSAVVILHALATVITASVFLLFHPVNLTLANANPLHASLDGEIRAAEAIAFVFVLTGLGFLFWMLWKQPQSQAANYRLAAEIGRSILAVWSIPGSASEIVRAVPTQFAHFARNLLLHHRLDPDRSRSMAEASPRNEVEKLAGEYVDHRVIPQIKYYSERYVRSKRAARTLEIISIIFSSSAVLSAGFLAFSSGSEFHRALWGLAKLIAATAAPVAVSMLVIHEVKRREARYHEMLHTLEQYAEIIRRVPSLSGLQNLVTDVERMLLTEIHEWWVLAKSNVAA